jgi:hypothetical protein
MTQYLIASCNLVTIVLLFLTFFIIRAVPTGSPLNIDLYRDHTIISFAIYNPVELCYWSNSPEEQVREHDWNTTWNTQDNQDSYNHFNNKNTWTTPQYTADQPPFSIMAAYNPRNFNLGQFMNDLYQQPDLLAQFQFLGNHLQVVNTYASAMEQELTQVTAITTAVQAQVQAQSGTLGAAPTSGTSKKVEVFTNPSNFSEEINHCEEWWLKMKTKERMTHTTFT